MNCHSDIERRRVITTLAYFTLDARIKITNNPKVRPRILNDYNTYYRKLRKEYDITSEELENKIHELMCFRPFCPIVKEFEPNE